jgi:hypothetical protein
VRTVYHIRLAAELACCYLSVWESQTSGKLLQATCGWWDNLQQLTEEGNQHDKTKTLTTRYVVRTKWHTHNRNLKVTSDKVKIIFTFFYVALFDPLSDHGFPCSRGFTITFRHTTLGRTPPDEWPARRRPLPDNTQHAQETDIHAPGGIRTHNPRKRTAEDPRRPRGHWDRHIYLYMP